MKLVFILLSFTITLLSCQKELSVETPTGTTTGGTTGAGLTDTSIILTKKLVGFGTDANGNPKTDSSLIIYKNNKINGIKGYIILDTGFNSHESVTTTFKYNTDGNLTDIIEADNAAPMPDLTIKLTWGNNRIKHIKWVETGSYGMDRNYSYTETHDSLLIRYSVNSVGGPYNDSTNVVLISDTGFNRILSIRKTGTFEHLTDTKGSFYNEINYAYTGNNMLSANWHKEFFYSKNSWGFYNEVDSAVDYFTRVASTNAFFNNLEQNILGKQIRMLCYDQEDTVNSILEASNFNYGSGWSSFGQDYLLFRNVFTGAFNPLLKSTSNYIVYRDGLVVDQKSGLLYKKIDYTFDAQNRIVTTKEYDVSNNQLQVISYYYYP